jgi:hypothetical protein
LRCATPPPSWPRRRRADRQVRWGCGRVPSGRRRAAPAAHHSAALRSR